MQACTPLSDCGCARLYSLTCKHAHLCPAARTAAWYATALLWQEQQQGAQQQRLPPRGHGHRDRPPPVHGGCVFRNLFVCCAVSQRFIQCPNALGGPALHVGLVGVCTRLPAMCVMAVMSLAPRPLCTFAVMCKPLRQELVTVLPGDHPAPLKKSIAFKIP
eukprot:1134489-Pelagomonas_calceolata.AAC.6